jgi:dodecin
MRYFEEAHGNGRNGSAAHDQDRFARRERERETVRHGNVVKVIEILAESDRGWEDAAERAVYEASRSVRNIKSLYVKDMQAVVKDGRIVTWRINAKISFAIDDDRDGQRY